MGERAGDPGTHVPFAAGKGVFDRFEAGGPSLHLGERTTEKQAEDQKDVTEGKGTPMNPIMRFASCFTIQHTLVSNQRHSAARVKLVFLSVSERRVFVHVWV